VQMQDMVLLTIILPYSKLIQIIYITWHK